MINRSKVWAFSFSSFIISFFVRFFRYDALATVPTRWMGLSTRESWLGVGCRTLRYAYTAGGTDHGKSTKLHAVWPDQSPSEAAVSLACQIPSILKPERS